MSSLLEGELSIFCPNQLNFPEGVAFDSEGVLWSGGAGGEVYRITRDLFVVPFAKLTGRLLGVTPATDGGILVCAMDEHRVVRVAPDGAISQVGPSNIQMPNFAAYNAAGSLFITDSGRWGERDGRLIRVDPDGRDSTILRGLAFPNGLAFAADFDQLYVAQSESRDVLVVDLNSRGEPSRPRVAFSLEALGNEVSGDTLPDGLAIDQDRNVYVTLPRVDMVVAWTPDEELVVVARDDGPAKDLEKIDFGQVLRSPTNIAFGGADFRDLYIANLRTRHLAVGRARIAGVPLPGQA